MHIFVRKGVSTAHAFGVKKNWTSKIRSRWKIVKVQNAMLSFVLKNVCRSGPVHSKLIQGTPEWLELRRSYIGASDAPVIMQMSPWMTPYQLWLNKMGFHQVEETQAMRRGKQSEEAARKDFEEATGLIVFPQVVFSKEHAFMMASLDGIDMDHKHIVEIKVPGHQDHQIAKQGNVPTKYIPQLQHQMAVTGLDIMYYYSWSPFDGTIIEVERDDKFIAEMIDKERAFYDCMCNAIPPELLDKDWVEKIDPEWTLLAQEFVNLSEKISSLEKRSAEVKQQLIQLAAQKNSRGAGVNVNQCTRKGSIDYKAIPELSMIDLEKYRKETTTHWRVCLNLSKT